MQRVHYGILVDSESPVTGVIHNHSAEWLIEEIYNPNSIDLVWEEHQLDCEEYQETGYCGCGTSQGGMLIGAWRLTPDGYEPDESGEYSAIVREVYTQIVHSRYVTRAALCSPCYPGQADLDTSGAYLAYTLPPDMFGEFAEVTLTIQGKMLANLGIGL